MGSKMKLVYFEIVFSFIVNNLNTVALENMLSFNKSDTVPNSQSFRKCLEYNGVNGTIDDLAALGSRNESQINYFCGGTLISVQFVLTAAHCKFSRQWRAVEIVRLGASQGRDNHHIQFFLVQDFYTHHNFKFPHKYHDIALIKLDQPAVFSSTVLPACLDFSRDQLPQSYLYVAGWGATDYGEKQSDRLQIGGVVKYNISDCQKTFPKEWTLPSSINDESQICAGAGFTWTDTCEDDSGGPLGHLYLLNRKPIHFVIGVTSFGKECMQGRLPAVYTRVSYYTDWIESILWPEKNRVLGDKIYFPTN